MEEQTAQEKAFLRYFRRWHEEAVGDAHHIDLHTPLKLSYNNLCDLASTLSRELGVRGVDSVSANDLVHEKSVEALCSALLLQVPRFVDWLERLVDEEELEGVSEEEEQQQEGAGGSRSALRNILDAEDAEQALDAELAKTTAVVIAARTHIPGRCIECEDRQADVHCVPCRDDFCSICFAALHRKGKRRSHEVKRLRAEAASQEQGEGAEPMRLSQEEVGRSFWEAESSHNTNHAEGEHSGDGSDADEDESNVDFAERAKYIPVRLSLKERKFLRLLQAELKVSDYTNKIDRPNLKKNKRMHAQIVELCAFLSGLIVAYDYEEGRQTVKSRAWKKHEALFQSVFEFGRRHKVMNPEKMRGEYGKLMYMLMDATRNEIQQLLGFNVGRPLTTVASFLKDRGAEAMLSDRLMEIATRAISPFSEDGRKSRYSIRQEVKDKEAAVKRLARVYSNAQISADDIKWCLYSIGDNRTFLLQHRDPVTVMIRYLKQFFSAQHEEEGYSLAIYGGKDGSRLTHSHERQYNYVLQSLTLWREILNEMFKLWYLGEEDMLDPSCPYKLTDTGQGWQRVQAAPRVGRAMRDLLFRTQKRLGNWVGSSVVHLGDKNVPNALIFIDKYTQVARILTPIVTCIKTLPELCEDEKTNSYIEDVFGGVEKCRKDILHDFFRSAFDGSGADNFFDAGSCIDGRLTSAWNWCAQIEQKRYFPVLKLTGFLSFDGDFQE